MWVDPEQPPRELIARAQEAMQVAVPHKEQSPLAFFDSNFLGAAGSQGMLFSNDGLYFRTSLTLNSGPSVGYIPYEEFPSRTFRQGGYFGEVSLDRGQFFRTVGSGMDSKRVLEMLNAVKTAIS